MPPVPELKKPDEGLVVEFPMPGAGSILRKVIVRLSRAPTMLMGDGHRRSADGEGDRRNGQRGCAEIDRAEEEQTAQIEGLGENGRGLGDRDHVAAEGHYVVYVNDHLLVYGDEWSGDREIDGNLALVIARHQEAIVEVARVESAGIDVAGIEEAGVGVTGL